MDNDAISRSAALEILNKDSWRYQTIHRRTAGAIRKNMDEIEKLPSLDVAPVVCCKDCEHWERSWECSSGNHGEHFCPMIGLVTDSDFYCKHGAKEADYEGDSFQGKTD